MAGFDPSVISQIGASTPNIVGAQQEARSNAMSLQSMMDERQLNRLKLSGAEQQSKRESQMRQILAGSDYSTPKGVTETAEKLSRAGLGPEAMDFTKAAQGIQAGNTQSRLGQYQLYNAQQQILGNAASGLISQYQSLVQGGTSPALASMIMQPRYQEALKSLGQQKLPDGSAALSPDVLKVIQANPTFNPQFVQGVALRSAQAVKALTAQMGILKDQAQIEEAHAREAEAAGRAGVAGERVVTLSKPDPQNPKGPGVAHQVLIDAKGNEVKDLGVAGKAGGGAAGGLGSAFGQIYGLRITGAGEQATASLQNISQLPVGASTGSYGIGERPGESMYQATRDTLRNAMSPQDVQDYNVLVAGLQRNLAQIETQGLAPRGSITGQMDAVVARAGDTNLTRLRKLAEARQIVDNGLRPQLTSQMVSPETKKEIQNILDRIDAAVPFTQNDLTKLQRRWSKHPETTLADIMPRKQKIIAPEQIGSSSGAPQGGTGSASFASEAQAEAAAAAGKIKAGDRITVGGVSGTWQ